MPLSLDSSQSDGAERVTIDRDALCRRLLVVLARTQVTSTAGSDPHGSLFQRCVEAALFILECAVPWSPGDQGLALGWAEQPDVYAESQIIEDLLSSGLAGIALGRLQPALLVYHWLCIALQDPRDVHLVWGVALLRVHRLGEARVCFSQLDDRDHLVQALMAVLQLHSEPADAVQQLRRIQAICVQPPVRELVRSILEMLDQYGDAVDLADCDVVAWNA